MITYFAHGAEAGRAPGHEHGDLQGGGHGAGRGHANACPVDGGGVDVVIAHVTNLRRFEAEKPRQLLQRDGDHPAALACYEEALRLRPTLALAQAYPTNTKLANTMVMMAAAEVMVRALDANPSATARVLSPVAS